MRKLEIQFAEIENLMIHDKVFCILSANECLLGDRYHGACRLFLGVGWGRFWSLACFNFYTVNEANMKHL